MKYVRLLKAVLDAMKDFFVKIGEAVKGLVKIGCEVGMLIKKQLPLILTSVVAGLALAAVPGLGQVKMAVKIILGLMKLFYGAKELKENTKLIKEAKKKIENGQCKVEGEGCHYFSAKKTCKSCRKQIDWKQGSIYGVLGEFLIPMIKKGHKKYKQRKTQKAAKQDFVKSKQELKKSSAEKYKTDKRGKKIKNNDYDSRQKHNIDRQRHQTPMRKKWHEK